MDRRLLTAAVAAVLVAWSAPAAAQQAEGEGHGPHPHPAHDAAAHVRHLDEALDLTDAQTERVRAIVTDVLERQRALHEETRTRIAGVLDEEQRTRLEALHGDMMANHGRGAGAAGGADHHPGPGHEPAGHATYLQEALGLTDAQTERVREILADVHERNHALHEDGMERLSEVLTEEQRARMESMHREMMRRHGPGQGSGPGGGPGAGGGAR